MIRNNHFNLPRPHPVRESIDGRYVRLEPLSAHHGQELYSACCGPENRSRFDYLFEDPPERQQDIDAWIERVAALDDPLFFAVIDQTTGRCEGRQALMRIVPEHGVIELGAIFWGLKIARTRVATEALFLHLKYAFDSLGYRRFEWKCNNLNEGSKYAAKRFGFTFEGVFRQHLVMKGTSRDTAWFSMIDKDWPLIRDSYERWLRPENFDNNGRQLAKLLMTRS